MLLKSIPNYTCHIWHIQCVKSDTWCQRGFGILLVQDHTDQCCWCNTGCATPAPCTPEGGGAKCVGVTVGVLLKLEDRVVEHSIIPNVGQLKLANVPVKGWIIDLDVHGLLCGPYDILHLPSYYG